MASYSSEITNFVFVAHVGGDALGCHQDS